MKTFQLSARKRDGQKADEARQNGFIPAIIYGPGIEGESLPVLIEYQFFRKTYRRAGESTIIELEIEGKNVPTLVHTIDFEPVSNDFEHIDFYALDMNQEVHTNIMLRFVGQPPVVKEKDAILVTAKENLEAKCLPKHLVHDIEVDISGFTEYHDHVLVKDIAIPEGITIFDDPEAVVISATAPKIEEPKEEEEGVEGEEGKKTEAEGESSEKEEEPKEEAKE